MTIRLMLLIRHADAEKNALGQFAGDNAADRLTTVGRHQLRSLILDVERLIKESGVKSVGIACSDSKRAETTAAALSPFASSRLIVVPEFRSIRSGIAAGLTEDEIQTLHPQFSQALTLYREGVLSSYRIPYPEGAEDVIGFECSVMAALSRLLTKPCELQIIVAHRSSITAILLAYARRAHGYPADFFGYIPLTAGLTSCIDVTAAEEKLLWVNRRVNTRCLALVRADRL